MLIAFCSATFPRVRPWISSSAPPAAVCSRNRPIRKPVPASLPRMPALAISAIMPARSCMFTPSVRATGAAYFIDSPTSSTVWFDLFAVWVRMSTTRPVSVVASPNARRLSAAMLPISSNDTAVASAPRTIPRSDCVVSSALKPALLNAVASAATSVGVPAATAATASISLRSAPNAPALPSIAAAFRTSASNLPACAVIPRSAWPIPAAARPAASCLPSDSPAWRAGPSRPRRRCSSC